MRARKDRKKMKGKRLMPSFKSQLEKARWMSTQEKRDLRVKSEKRRQRLCWIPSFSKAEEKRNRMKALAKDVLRYRLVPFLGHVDMLNGDYEKFRKLARMVLR